MRTLLPTLLILVPAFSGCFGDGGNYCPHLVTTSAGSELAARIEYKGYPPGPTSGVRITDTSSGEDRAKFTDEEGCVVFTNAKAGDHSVRAEAKVRTLCDQYAWTGSANTTLADDVFVQVKIVLRVSNAEDFCNRRPSS